MSVTLPGSEFLSLLIWGNAKAAVLIGLAILAMGLMRRLSAASRHLLWANLILASLLLPILSELLPSLQLPILPTGMADTTGIAAAAVGQRLSGQAAAWAHRIELTDILCAIYVLGATILLASFARALVQLHRLEKAAQAGAS